jgi:hypothetical protein
VSCRGWRALSIDFGLEFGDGDGRAGLSSLREGRVECGWGFCPLGSCGIFCPVESRCGFDPLGLAGASAPNGGDPDREVGWDLGFVLRLELDRTLTAFGGVDVPLAEVVASCGTGGGLDQSDAELEAFGCALLLYLWGSLVPCAASTRIGGANLSYAAVV